MSADFHAVVRGPSFTGAGAFPVRTHAHQVLLPIGMSAGIGGFASRLPIICAMRRKAALVWLERVCKVYLRFVKYTNRSVDKSRKNLGQLTFAKGQLPKPRLFCAAFERVRDFF